MGTLSLDAIIKEHELAKASRDKLMNQITEDLRQYDLKGLDDAFDKLDELNDTCSALNGMRADREISQLNLDSKDIIAVITDMETALKRLKTVAGILRIAGSVVDIGQGIITKNAALLEQGVKTGQAIMSNC